ncbi:sigma-54 interaction domain-containing protein [Desulfitibacter alkalitolerans]|uniref:sigma-54 interaction domain-containing protein n=1 Tax=Desulfitibacter alkalitolerans TaxID=264641 RepID=UPI000486B5C8|nr:sigma-54-dependent Fis family transcriptional regulator [Desulfitibacter alkalitolerans]
MEFHLNEGIEKHIFLSILDAIDSAITVIDCNGVTIFYNKAASKIEGLDPEEVIGKHLLSIYPSLNENNSSLLTVLKTKWPVVEQQQTLVTRTGKKATVVYSTYPLFKDGVLIGAFDISRDITEIKNLSERLVDLQAKLMDSKKSPMASSAMAPSHNSNYASIYTLDDIIGESPSIVKLKKLAQRVAYSPSPILIYGETGTGKEVLVQAIHNEGTTSTKPFVAQNCAALPATLLESILMGTVKGSFTGSEDRPGLLEIAHEGTLLLDEINSMPLDLQSKILRVLQEGSFRRIGDTKLRYARPRIVACTNVDPAEAVKNKQLRIDLYYRLNVISLYIPPLRERKEDIPLLVKHFISRLNDKFHINIKGVDDRVMSAFHCYDWPGNVRELQHCLEHAVNVMSGSTIKSDHLPFYFTSHFNKKNIIETKAPQISNFQSLPETLNSIEGTLILEALKESNWNVTQAARMLKIPRQTLQYKMRNLELDKNKGGSL